MLRSQKLTHFFAPPIQLSKLLFLSVSIFWRVITSEQSHKLGPVAVAHFFYDVIKNAGGVLPEKAEVYANHDQCSRWFERLNQSLKFFNGLSKYIRTSLHNHHHQNTLNPAFSIFRQNSCGLLKCFRGHQRSNLWKKTGHES